MTTTANTRRFFMGFMGLVSAVTITTPLLFSAEPASANCRVSSTALQVAKLTNRVRAKYRLRPLRFNCRLYRAAQRHTVDMVKRNKISHTGSDGSSVGVRVKRSGYKFSAVAENVAKGQRTPSQVVKSWMNSPGHRRNILNPRYTEIGVGYANRYWTQVFARPR
ncbi:MAG: CAP domain-containing protein [Calothrix sp. MO_192.B10]|nr:CAP domain-containing protein [Calothrix sp. MO_192.B10]